MPSIEAPAKVLVTGANGFVAVWIIRTLLDHGYSVRGTVRAVSKSVHLRNVFTSELENGRVELVVVSDLTDPGAFEEAVKGVDGIFHTASPVTLNADDPNELIGPAVKGTVGILESALKFAGPQLKRIVITSSTAAVRETPTAIGTFDETSWNEGCLVEVGEKGRNASPMGKYCASKTLAEKAAWNFVSKHKSELSWDLVTICPPYIFGPILSEVSSPSELKTSMAQFYEAVFCEDSLPDALNKFQANWVDVRDIALGHVRALEVPEAGGERFLLSNEPFVWRDWHNAANQLNIPGLKIPAGVRGVDERLKYTVIYDSAKTRRVLGLEFRDMRQTLKDIVEDRKAHGW